MRTVHSTASVFPNSTLHYNIEIPPYFEGLGLYTQTGFYITVAARLEYCDANRSLHWTQLGVGKSFFETEPTVRHNAASLHPGEANHPKCQEEEEP